MTYHFNGMKENIRDYILAAIGILVFPVLAIVGLVTWIVKKVTDIANELKDRLLKK